MWNDIWSEELFEQADDEIARLRSETEDLEERIDELLDKIDELKNHEWISVNDRMPEHRAMYITCDELNIVEATMFDGNEDAVWNTVAGTKVMHWMPLPEPPEEKKDEAD